MLIWFLSSIFVVIINFYLPAVFPNVDPLRFGLEHRRRLQLELLLGLGGLGPQRKLVLLLAQLLALAELGLLQLGGLVQIFG